MVPVILALVHPETLCRQVYLWNGDDMTSSGTVPATVTNGCTAPTSSSRLWQCHRADKFRGEMDLSPATWG